MDLPTKFKVIGLMSGTSLDGVDIACCIIRKREGQWVYAIEVAQTVKYSKKWFEKLQAAHQLSGIELMKLHAEYGKYLGFLVEAFVMKNKLRGIDFIASHGHTIFHQPERGITFQLGEGHALFAASGIPVICDFRSLDVAFSGQGAPLVPVGDALLFHEYDMCLNLGGIANLSLEINSKREAFDICFVNMALNYLANKAGQFYDRNGNMASKGEIDKTLLSNLDKVYQKLEIKRPSLSYEIFEKQIKPVLDKSKASINNKLRTVVESSALAIVSAMGTHKKPKSLLCTGGGAFNSFLIYRIIENCPDLVSLIIPEEDIIKYKEALVFSFLGVLRVRNENNALKTVTGAKSDSSGGIMIGFKN